MYRNRSLSSTILFFLLVINITVTFSQPGQWTWLHGDSTTNSPGNYGVKGVSSPLNEPPGLYEPCEWTDQNGNFWMYGGTNYNSDFQNDLWKYDVFTNEWTWMFGTQASNDSGYFGIKGVSSPLNRPPGGGFGNLSWVDLNGNLWMYGCSLGTVSNKLSDLWKYDIGTNEWTWINGPGIPNTTPVYGTITIPDTANNPGARHETAAAWTDNNNNLWLFGGRIVLGLADLWKYNISSNTWTWMKGPAYGSQTGVWGVKGVEDPANYPSPRWVYSHWKDQSGNLWLFGGNGKDSTQQSRHLGDLWRYNIVTNNWTWISGSNLDADFQGVYGTKCIASPLNRPPHRVESRTCWTDASGNFLMFGGLYATGTVRNGFNDLWHYNVSTNEWTWISGDDFPNSIGSYGIKGISSPTNTPPERYGPVGWKDNNGNLYLFGGNEGATGSLEMRNDLWKYVIDTGCVVNNNNLLPQSLFTQNVQSVCEGSCITFTNYSANASTFQWYFPGGAPSSDTSLNPPPVCYNIQGMYDVSLISFNANGTDTLTINNAVTVFPPAQFTGLVQNGDTIFALPGFASYQWYFDSTLISGANNYYHVANQDGNYTVVAIDSNGCSSAATLFGVITRIENHDSGNKLIVFYSENTLSLKIDLPVSKELSLRVIDQLGQIIYNKPIRMKENNNQIELHGIKLSPGIYLLIISNDKLKIAKEFFVK